MTSFGTVTFRSISRQMPKMTLDAKWFTIDAWFFGAKVFVVGKVARELRVWAGDRSVITMSSEIEPLSGPKLPEPKKDY